MANLKVNVIDGNNLTVEVTPVPKQIIQINRGVSGKGGEGIPTGGTTGQVLAKASNANYDTEWETLATVATTGSYDDLTDKPTIPPAQVNSDWDATSGVAEILNKPTLATVATTGDYDDLIDKPTLGTISSQNANNVNITGGSISGTTVSGYIPTTEKGTALGVATLDSSGKVPTSQIPLQGDLNYQGTWNANTNTPTLTSSVGTKGYYYVVDVAGSTNLNGITDWNIGDWAIFNGSIWQKVDNTDAVTSVNGYTGTVVLTQSDIANTANAPTNTNITSMTGVTGGISSPDFVQFDTGITPTVGVGKLQWDTDAGGLQVGMTGGNVNLQIGQELVQRIYNNTGSTLTDGQIVYVTGSQGQRLTVALAKADADSTSATIIGMVTEPIPNNSSGFITTEGIVNNVNTNGIADGTILWLSPTTAGAYTPTKPQAPEHLVMVGYVVKGNSTGGGSIFVKVQNGYELNELHDVLITSPTSGNTLIYDAVLNVWKNANLTAGTGISVTNGAGSISIANTAPDQTVALSSGTGINVSGTYPNFTITNTSPSSGGTVTAVTGTSPVVSSGGTTPAISMAKATGSVDGYLSSTDWTTFNNKGSGTVTSVSATAGTGISITGSPITSSGTLNITNTAPDQVVSLTAGSNISVSGTYPNFTISASGGGTGTVTSVDMTVPTGLSISGNPITSSGTLALTYASGYSIPTTTSQGNWDTAYTDRLKWDGGSTGLVASTGRTSLGASTLGSNIFTITNPSAVTFPRFNADNTISALTASDFRTAIGAGTGSGTVTSVSGTAPISSTGGTTPAISISQASSTTDGYLSSTDWNTFNNKTSNTGTVTSVSATVPTGLSISGSPITTSGTLAITYTAGYSIPTTASQTNWDSAYTQRLQWDGGSTNLVASTGRTSLGATTLGGNLFTITNPSAITFPRFNADNTVSALDASTFRTAIGAGTGSGTVTSVSGTGSVNGITLTGTVTSSGSLTLGGTLGSIANSQLTNSSVTFNGQTVALGSTGTITANTNNALTIGTGLSGTSFNGSSAVTIAIDSTVATLSGTQTLTNKRVNARVNSAGVTTGTITPNGDTTDVLNAYGLTGAIVFAVPSGTPVDGQRLMIRLEDNGTARGITWTGTAGGYRAIGVTLPTTTVATKLTYVGCVYNSTDSFWDVIAVTTQA